MKTTLGFRTRLGLAFGTVLALSAVIAAAAFRSSYWMSNAADGIVAGAKEQNLTMEMEWALASQSDALRGFLLSSDGRMADQCLKADAHFTESAAELAVLPLSSQDRATFDSLVAAERQTRLTNQQVT